MSTKISVNGRMHELDVDPAMPLLWVLRDRLGFTGTKFGCGVAQCGACTVHIDGKPTRSCVTPVGSVANAEVVTVEAVSGPEADAVRAAWEGIDVPQCGYCQSGQVMSAVALLRDVPDPDDAAIDRAMDGNLCRCATYARIRRGIHDAAATLKSKR
ncbi:MAG: (2Fe-2S)-binding protein [Pseudomonadota bacterium]